MSIMMSAKCWQPDIGERPDYILSSNGLDFLRCGKPLIATSKHETATAASASAPEVWTHPLMRNMDGGGLPWRSHSPRR
jgi:hypothetical protein